MPSPVARLVIGIVVGGLVALLVYYVGTEVTDFRNESTIWGLLAVLVWALIAWLSYDRGYRRRAP